MKQSSDLASLISDAVHSHTACLCVVICALTAATVPWLITTGLGQVAEIHDLMPVGKTNRSDQAQWAKQKPSNEPVDALARLLAGNRSGKERTGKMQQQTQYEDVPIHPTETTPPSIATDPVAWLREISTSHP